MKFDSNNLIPAIIQDSKTLQVLMLAYMNQEAYDETLKTKRVTFYSRSKQRLWVKGETSGNYLNLVSIDKDCDNDTLLIKVIPEGPACHLNTTSCFGDQGPQGTGFLAYLEQVIIQRSKDKPEGSYTAKLMQEGLTRLAQKVGEEGVEVALAAVVEQEKLCDEMADLWYHALMLLVASGKNIDDIIVIMQKRHADYAAKG
ncbi:MAG: bifunctional phosphoribosyl-AMP cyclohydrolase/phosphoribosyl-ATP diphosphatase HisIE [Legionellales bacterium]|jgi:phosphoribosyl-ATP pyrophosphohydrolase/phosphoribosyl-AMP cyclohydrolase